MRANLKLPQTNLKVDRTNQNWMMRKILRMKMRSQAGIGGFLKKNIILEIKQIRIKKKQRKRRNLIKRRLKKFRTL